MNKWTWHDIKKQNRACWDRQPTAIFIETHPITTLRCIRVMLDWLIHASDVERTFHLNCNSNCIFFNLIIYEATVQKHTMEPFFLFFISAIWRYNQVVHSDEMRSKAFTCCFFFCYANECGRLNFLRNCASLFPLVFHVQHKKWCSLDVSIFTLSNSQWMFEHSELWRILCYRLMWK